MKDNTYISDNTLAAAEEAFGVPGYTEATKQAQIARLTPKQKLVYQAIQENPEAANDDTILLAAVWQKEGWQVNEFLHINLKRVSRPETLSRRRRQLHQMGLIEYSEKADKERMQAFVSERDQASPMPLKYELMTINGERVMKVVNDLVDSVKPEQVSLI